MSSHEPRRLLSIGPRDGLSTSSDADAGPSPFARSLLLAGTKRAERRPPDGASERVWGSIALAGIAAGAAGAGAAALMPGTATATKSVGVLAAITKAKLLVVAVVAVGVASVGTTAVVVSRTASSDARGPDTSVVVTVTPLPSVQTKAAATDPVPTPPSAAIRPDDLPTAAPVISSKTPPPPKPVVIARAPAVAPVVGDATSGSSLAEGETAPAPAQTRESELRQEADLLAAARADLARGDASSATKRIAESKRRFPNGMLVEEREALEVRAVDATGDHRRATTLARAFLERHPKSPSRSSIEPLAKASSVP